MKKILLLVAASAAVVGAAVVAKSRSEQLKAAAARVTGDPRVQSALATVSSSFGSGTTDAEPATDHLEEVPPAAVEEVAAADPVSAPEFTGFERPVEPTADAVTEPVTEPEPEPLAPEPVPEADPAEPEGEEGAEETYDLAPEPEEAEFTGFEPPVVESADFGPETPQAS